MTNDEIVRLTIDHKLHKDIISTLTGLWYKTIKVDAILQSCPHELTRENLGEIMKYAITKISTSN
jgi:hypothetical protein